MENNVVDIEGNEVDWVEDPKTFIFHTVAGVLGPIVSNDELMTDPDTRSYWLRTDTTEYIIPYDKILSIVITKGDVTNDQPSGDSGHTDQTNN